MFRSLLVPIYLLTAGFLKAAPGPNPLLHGQTYEKDIKPLLQKYCWDCHGDGAKKGDLNLDPYKDEDGVAGSHKAWASVQFNMDNWMMPPAKKDQPTLAERDQITQYLESVLNPYDPTKPDPGRVTIRRLNRVEYNNTVRDLLGVDVKPANDFPEDDTGYGFDTIGDVLTLPPILMERYLSAADKVLDVAIPKAAAPSTKTNFSGNALKGDGSFTQDSKFYTLANEGEAGVKYEFPSAGTYVLRAKVFAAQAGGELAKVDLHQDAKVLKTEDVAATELDKSQKVEVQFESEAGQKQIGVSFLNDFYDKNAPADKRDRNLFVVSLEIEGPLKTDKPMLGSQVTSRIFGAGTQLGETEAGARAILETFANRAFRRHTLAPEVDRLLTIYKLAQKKGENHRESLKLAMKAIMVSPYFLYRMEYMDAPDNPASVVDINEFSLASRLSYFLWSSMPDDELLSLAFRNEMRKNFRPQILRMLKDPKARALASNFGGQWLETRSLDVVQPSPKQFKFPTPLREAMKQETEEFFWYIQQENRSVLDFVNADYTFVNERLAQHYGLPGVSGAEFRKVSLPAASQRRGVLTQGSVLTLTSDPTRTSPVKRGKWIMENILGIAAPPPPPNVPALDGADKGQITGTVRHRLEQHRSTAGCASCHALIDPMGFGLESFDPIGAFRGSDNGLPLDTTGVLTTGQKFSNALELSDVIMKDKRELFLRCVIKKMLTYALGRGPEAYDKPAIDGIVEKLNKDDAKFQTLIVAMAESLPFQKRRGDSGQKK